MKKISYHTMKNKADWGDGPWVTEPDKMQWQDRATKLPCLIVRNNGGALCGYVGVTEGHPAFGKESVGDIELGVHGGITFSGFCQPHDDEHSKGICHIPGKGEPDRVFWLGFDCSHLGDVSPRYERELRFPKFVEDQFYKDFTYVRRQVAQLARQLHKLKG